MQLSLHHQYRYIQLQLKLVKPVWFKKTKVVSQARHDFLTKFAFQEI